MSSSNFVHSEPSSTNVNIDQSNEFPYGSVTLSLPDWNAIVNYIYSMQTHLKPLRSVLAHLEVSDDAQTHQELDKVSSDLWAGYHTLAVLVREIRRHEGVKNNINF